MCFNFYLVVSFVCLWVEVYVDFESGFVGVLIVVFFGTLLLVVLRVYCGFDVCFVGLFCVLKRKGVDEWFRVVLACCVIGLVFGCVWLGVGVFGLGYLFVWFVCFGVCFLLVMVEVVVVCEFFCD